MSMHNIPRNVDDFLPQERDRLERSTKGMYSPPRIAPPRLGSRVIGDQL